MEELLDLVKLSRELLERRPSECSGGQKQRVAIARALSLSPALLIADEITSALDPKTEDEILKLLVSLKNEQRMSILHITHRLESIDGFADRMAVMKDGVIVEENLTEEVLRNPQADYTRALLEACSFG
ncbi:ABC transporter ATP-binding protein [Paenibacillus sp. SYP-B3998]|uniref:ABC transporter ATP-binding protein n=1 Tax=Paenibacillus sp. SYP-B3998 TaxID=2678564 RepID=A0A6G4A0K0_9BACL|nr:ABC transporter ATP-binding protein [Paenibacillus sp. SYP-B3998]